MIVYVELNFVLELALQQQQYEACEHIIDLCSTKKIRLIVPAYCLAETYETTVRNAQQRNRFNDEFKREAHQITRSRFHQTEAEAISKVTDLFVSSIVEEKSRLDQTIKRLLKVATIIPLSKNTLVAALTFQNTLALSPQDANVFTSVMRHVATMGSVPKCFLNRNYKDFKNPSIVEMLDTHGCKLMFSFEDGFKYIQSALS